MNTFKTTPLFVAILIVFLAGTTPKYDIGDVVTDFKLKNVDGRFVTLSSFKSVKGIILIFDCNTCPVSKAYSDRIIALNKKYAPKGYPVVAINPNDPEMSPGDSFDEMVAVAKRKGYDFPYLVDEKQLIAKAFGASNTPHTFVLKKGGEAFSVQYIGAIDNNSRDASAADKKFVENAVEELLAEKPVTTPKTKAIGCGIRYRE